MSRLELSILIAPYLVFSIIIPREFYTINQYQRHNENEYIIPCNLIYREFIVFQIFPIM